MFWWLIKISINLTGSWLSGLLSADIFIGTCECGVQMSPLAKENSQFLRSGPDEVSLIMSASASLHWARKTVNFCGQGLRMFLSLSLSLSPSLSLSLSPFVPDLANTDDIQMNTAPSRDFFSPMGHNSLDWSHTTPVTLLVTLSSPRRLSIFSELTHGQTLGQLTTTHNLWHTATPEGRPKSSKSGKQVLWLSY